MTTTPDGTPFTDLVTLARTVADEVSVRLLDALEGEGPAVTSKSPTSTPGPNATSPNDCSGSDPTTG